MKKNSKELKKDQPQKEANLFSAMSQEQLDWAKQTLSETEEILKNTNLILRRSTAELKRHLTSGNRRPNSTIKPGTLFGLTIVSFVNYGTLCKN